VVTGWLACGTEVGAGDLEGSAPLRAVVLNGAHLDPAGVGLPEVVPDVTGPVVLAHVSGSFA
jgi:hypothetical protein